VHSFSCTFPLRSFVFSTGPLFSITFPLRSVKKDSFRITGQCQELIVVAPWGTVAFSTKTSFPRRRESIRQTPGGAPSRGWTTALRQAQGELCARMTATCGVGSRCHRNGRVSCGHSAPQLYARMLAYWEELVKHKISASCLAGACCLVGAYCLTPLGSRGRTLFGPGGFATLFLGLTPGVGHARWPNARGDGPALPARQPSACRAGQAC
jgi:hypothetical protein